MSATREPQTLAGRLEVTSMLHAARPVTVRTYLPPDYECTDTAFRVIYMFDGHNLFDARTSTYNQDWQIGQTMERLTGCGLEPAVVVGIDAPMDRWQRYAQYTICEWDFSKRPDGRRLRRIYGEGAATAAFLLGDVKAATEARYRVRADRRGVGVGGSSMGAYMSLYIAARYPELVANVIAMSPVVLDHPMRGSVLRDYIVAAGAPLPQRIWIDMGDNEELDHITSPQELVDHLWVLRDSLAEAGHQDLAVHLIPGGDHSERSWAARFEAAYRWAFDGVEPALNRA